VMDFGIILGAAAWAWVAAAFLGSWIGLSLRPLFRLA